MALDSSKLEVLKSLERKDHELFKRVLEILKNGLSAYEKALTKKVDAALSKLDQKQRGLDGKNGRDGVQGPRGERGEKGERGERGPQGLPGKDGRDGKNGRDADEEKLLKLIDERIASMKGSGSNATAFQIVHTPTHEQFTMNGSDTSVTLQNAPSANGRAAWVYYNGQFLALSNTYTVNGNKIELTFTPDNGSTIEVLYIP